LHNSPEIITTLGDVAPNVRPLGYYETRSFLMGPIGIQEMMLIFIVALVLFGPKKLPELGRLLGKGLTEFRRARNELKSTFETHLRELEREANLQDELKKSAALYPSSTSSSTSYSYDESGRHETDYSSPTPYQAASAEPASLSSSTASATAIQDAEANREIPSTTVTPVAGTVPRTSTAATEGHSA
jgi:TatA/E family protein of Tat protein translocase